MACSNHLKCFKSILALNRSFCRGIQVRNLLSPAVYCDAEWRNRLSSTTLSKVNADFMISQLFIQFDKASSATAVDMEVFANKIPDVHPTQLHVVESLLKKFRRCGQAVSAIDSMSHAVIRGYLELKQMKRLIPILQNKVDYGIFPDNHAFCLLLDQCILDKDFHSGSKIAFEMMLQEELSHPTSNLLALYTCSQYLYEDQDQLLAPVTDENKPELDGEEDEYVVVKFIPTFTYDNHFDVTDEKKLLGKTLAKLGQKNTSIHPVYLSLRLIGLALDEQFDQLFSELNRCLESNTAFHKETLELFEKCLEACKYRTEIITRDSGYGLKEDAEYNARHSLDQKEEFIKRFQELKPQLEKLSLLESSLLSDTEILVTEGLESRANDDAEEYKTQIEAWNDQRMANVLLQERAFTLKQRKETLEKKVKDLSEKEALLNYFVRQNDVSLALMRAAKPKQDDGDIDLEEYVAEPGKRGKKGKLG